MARNAPNRANYAPWKRRQRLRVLSFAWTLVGIVVNLLLTAIILGSRNIPIPGQEFIFINGFAIFVFLFILETLRNTRHLPDPNMAGVMTMLFVVSILATIMSHQAFFPDSSLAGVLASFAVIYLVLLIWIRVSRRNPYEHLLVVPCVLRQDLLQSKVLPMQLKAIDAEMIPELDENTYDGVVFDPKDPITPEWYEFILKQRFANHPVYEAGQIYEQVTGRVSLRHLDLGYAGDLLPKLRWYTYLKRPFDVLSVFLTLPITLTIMLVTAVLIKLESPGKVIFTQKRVGYGNKEFIIYKFRSMRLDAESKGSKFADHKDSRITRVGAFIRKFRIDELPQIWNILKGEMSWIGPRPEQPKFVQEFEVNIPYYASRHLVLPGITGWAQVMQGYAANTEETAVKLSYDLYYLRHLSHWLDLLIVYKTLRTILTGFGAR